MTPGSVILIFASALVFWLTVAYVAYSIARRNRKAKRERWEEVADKYMEWPKIKVEPPFQRNWPLSGGFHV